MKHIKLNQMIVFGMTLFSAVSAQAVIPVGQYFGTLKLPGKGKLSIDMVIRKYDQAIAPTYYGLIMTSDDKEGMAFTLEERADGELFLNKVIVNGSGITAEGTGDRETMIGQVVMVRDRSRIELYNQVVGSELKVKKARKDRLVLRDLPAVPTQFRVSRNQSVVLSQSSLQGSFGFEGGSGVSNFAGRFDVSSFLPGIGLARPAQIDPDTESAMINQQPAGIVAVVWENRRFPLRNRETLRMIQVGGSNTLADALRYRKR